jgi:hypothetical protein
MRLIGAANNLSNNGFGAAVDGSFLRLTNTTFGGNTTDLRLTFGSKARLVNSVPTTLVCDGTQLLVGATCP